MNTQLLEIDYEEWFDLYKPVQNPIDNNASFDGCLFETSGAEHKYIVDADQLRVWTLLDNDGVLTVSNGYHRVNRMGYFVTEVPYMDGQLIDVKVDTEPDDTSAVE